MTRERSHHNWLNLSDRTHLVTNRRQILKDSAQTRQETVSLCCVSVFTIYLTIISRFDYVLEVLETNWTN